MGQGVSCHHCGASTPLPDDLRIAVFTCNFCRAQLHTVSYAGAAAVSADALLGHVRAAMSSAAPVASSVELAPRFQGGRTLTRPAECQHCRAPVAVPLDLQVQQLTCTGCGRTQLVNRYISDGERFALDMQRQVAGNEAFARRACPAGSAEGRTPCPTTNRCSLHATSAEC